jgi:ankyrin repeat protein
MCQLLLEYGADISQRDVVGATPLIHAAARGATAAVQLLLGSKAGANLGRQWLLQQATAGGETALMAAAKGGHLDTLQVIRSSSTML